MTQYGPIFAATALILLAEIVAGRHRGIYRWSDAAVIGLAAILNPMVTRVLAGILFAAVATAIAPAHQGALADVPLAIAFPVTLVLAEFCFYWGHRWAHEGQRNPGLTWLWKIHRTHHAGAYMNVLVTLRLNLFWSFLVPTAWVIGFAIYLGQPEAAGLTGISIYAWNLITHSHFRWDDAVRRHPRWGRAFRALEHVLISPGMHHTHHGYGRDGASYRNYAVTLAVFDWMFGTIHIPKGRPWRYGVPGPRLHWAEELLYPLVRIRPKPAAKADGTVPDEASVPLSPSAA